MTATTTYRRYSTRLGLVTIPPRECPDTDTGETECTCAYHTAHPVAA